MISATPLPAENENDPLARQGKGQKASARRLSVTSPESPQTVASITSIVQGHVGFSGCDANVIAGPSNVMDKSGLLSTISNLGITTLLHLG